MRVSTVDATSFGLMVGVGETYLPAFALAVGMGEVVAGLISSIPMLIGGLLQVVSPWIVGRYVSEKRWVVSSSILQGCAFIPLILAAISGSMSTLALMMCTSMYWVGGLACGPTWNSWIDKLIPRPVRANYFAKRSRSAQIATASGYLGAGALLHMSQAGGWQAQAFAGLFFVAWISRSFSCSMLAIHKPPRQRAYDHLGVSSTPPSDAKSTALVAVPFPRRVVSPRDLILYLAMVQAVVQISGPYYAPYMLKHLDMSYIGFAVMIAAMFIAKILAVAAWGQFAKRSSAQWLLLAGGALIVPSSALWTLSTNYAWLISVQIFSGIGWAAYELGFFLMFFDSVPITRRVRMLTVYNLANTTAWCCGALAGGWLLYHLGPNEFGYKTLFMLSAVGRGLAFAFLLTRCSQTVSAFHQAGATVQAGMRWLKTARVGKHSASIDPTVNAAKAKRSEDLAA